MHRDIERILIPRERIAQRVRELARQMIADMGDTELTIVPILTGAMIFCGDLIREIPNAMQIGLMTVSSYPGRSVSTQGAQLIQRQLGNVRGRHVLVIDDILDSGSTMRLVLPAIREMGPNVVRSCVLLRKDRPAAREVNVDYVGFEIPDEFVVGYGLDYNDYYRNLPDIVTLKRSILERATAPQIRNPNDEIRIKSE
jgi:hypoxanthine phosphoribosyltransferase